MRRFFKQLELNFIGHDVTLVGGTRSASALLINGGEAAVFSASSSERPIHLRRRDYDLESQARQLLRSLGAHTLAREVRVEWNPRLKTCAGRADFREKRISLNPLLLHFEDALARSQVVTRKLECNKHSTLTKTPKLKDSSCKLECKMHSSFAKNDEAVSRGGQRRKVVSDEVDRTLRHELAHLLAQFRVGRRRIAPHGEEWRRACRDLGIANEARCHNLPFATKSYAVRFVYRCPNCRQEFPRVRRIRRAIACLSCCRKHNRGDFDPRFRLKLITTK